MIAVAAEVVARFLFFELAQDPELLARLFVLYSEKGSADEEQGADEEETPKDARTVGGPVRLNQVCVQQQHGNDLLYPNEGKRALGGAVRLSQPGAYVQ